MRLVSYPALDHFTPTYLDHFPVKILYGMCNPNAMLGQSLQVTEKRCPQSANPIECNQMGDCHWDSSWSLSCPNEGGCMNLDCLNLDSTLTRQGFTCEMCLIENGTLYCDVEIYNPVMSGLCHASPCMLNCGISACGAASSSNCIWNTTAGACYEETCSERYTTDSGACILDPECEWSANQSYCRNNKCTIWDDESDCTANNCEWITYNTPAVC